MGRDIWLPILTNRNYLTGFLPCPHFNCFFYYICTNSKSVYRRFTEEESPGNAGRHAS